MATSSYRTSIPAFSTWLINESVYLVMIIFPYPLSAMFNVPPRRFFSSKMIGLKCRSFSTSAASIPAGPPPTTTTFLPSPFFRGVEYSRSLPATGLTAHFTRCNLHISSKQVKQPMHKRISSLRPSNDFLHHSGSARWPRATPIRSHTPSCNNCSPISGSLMLQTEMTGMLTTFFMASAIYFSTLADSCPDRCILCCNNLR